MLEPQTIQILIVEDNEVDLIAIQRAFQKSGIVSPITIVKNGLEALDVLRGTNGQKKLSAPFIILLDLNLPKMNGFEFLTELRNDADLKSSVVFVLTTSRNDNDRKQAYAFHVAGYLVKSGLRDSFVRIAEMLDRYLRTVELPSA